LLELSVTDNRPNRVLAVIIVEDVMRSNAVFTVVRYIQHTAWEGYKHAFARFAAAEKQSRFLGLFFPLLILNGTSECKDYFAGLDDPKQFIQK
jgi:hypothetical protein